MREVGRLMIGNSAGYKRGACAGLALLASLVLALPARAQVTVDAYRDYFLYGQFGEVCTMCEVVVLCKAGKSPPRADRVPPDGDFTLYHLQKRTFWSQMGTIWEWFVSNIRQDGLAAQGHTRPVHVYRVTSGSWSSKEVIEGRLVLDPGLLEFGDRNIDRISRAWSGINADATLGFCSRLPLWDALDSIEANAMGAEQ